ncbi:MAG: amidohydrolase family protein, partial [Gemmatimonadota bacterium]|nr:amidohydrolase family protein [Gemmatimonadota bacterium]
MKRSKRAVVGLALMLAIAGSGCAPDAPAGPPADTVLHGDNIVTMDPGQPTVEAVAVRGETITAAGSLDDVMAFRGESTRVVDLGERALLPGFIDAHGHFLGAGRALDALSLHSPPVGDVTNIDELVEKIRGWIEEKDIPPGEVVSGGGYDDSLLAEKRHPTRFDL